ncbi:MAG: hypothetical protein IKO26_02865 [Paludibacteraceae bacterium]|nr:hypothetical protein [Paludibacteraceae bacterium]
MKIAGYIITPLGVFAFIGTLLGGHSPIGPLFWIAVGIVLLVLGYRKDKHRGPKENENRTEDKIDMGTSLLLREILKQTSPDNYVEPYDAERVKCATILYQKAKDTNANHPLDVLELVERTTKDLECQYPAELIYSYLLAIFKPTANSSDFDWCNDLCQQLYNAKDSVEDMIFIVKHEIDKKETQKKIELENKRIEKIRQKRLEDEESKKEAIRILKVIGIIIAITAVFMIIYIPIDYCRINKDKPHVWTLIDSKTKCIGGYKYGETKSNVGYLITIPDNFKGNRRSDNNLSNCFYDYYGNSINFVLVSQTILPVIENKIQQYKKDGFRIEYKVNTDSLVWFTYEKYSLLDSGHLLGNCVFILKPSPIMDSPFPNYDNRNILLCCDGFGVTKEIADSIASSIRIKFDTLSNNTYHASHTLKKYRSVRKKDRDIYDHSNYYYDETKSEISLTIPNDFYQVKEHNRITSDDTCSSLFMTNNMDAGISIISHPKESITYFLYPTDSIIEVSSIKCKVAGCDAIKIEALGFCVDKEYKYILYQLIKDKGYSTYQEPIYGKETYNISNEERQYINGVLVNANQPYKQTRTIIKGYKPNLKKIKNDDLYMSLLFGMTPEWHNNNKGIVDTVINSIKIIDK